MPLLFARSLLFSIPVIRLGFEGFLILEEKTQEKSETTGYRKNSNTEGG